MTRFLTWYGDDFTGSTDVMEALAAHGIKTVLFTRVPTPKEFAPFSDFDAVGLAGTSRSRSPDWMDAHLPEAFTWLKSLDARFCHYKVCSTFDSSPRIGSIGRAIDIGQRVFDEDRTTLIVGVPQLQRYTFAGHLFATYQGRIHRIDRHPVMSVHPVTPMHESDVLRHLALQTDAACDLLDVYDAPSQRAAGEALLALSPSTYSFVVGSSGVEYALLRALDRQASQRFDPVAPVDRLAVVSGSVSPTTARQIAYAVAHGFTPVPVDPVALAEGRVVETREEAFRILESGGSPLIHSAAGPETDRGEALSRIEGGRQALSEQLGRLARMLVERAGLRRLVIAGGDTSSHALGQLDIHALTMRFPLLDTPGSPLCRAASRSEALDGLEIAMKGGQIGRDDYFVRLRDGIA